jgi:hypothetical protein
MRAARRRVRIRPLWITQAGRVAASSLASFASADLPSRLSGTSLTP